jgi:hypothetical protein
MANAGAARGQPVAMATQETHHTSMAQLVKSSPVLTAIERESKRLRLRTASHVYFVPSVWMTIFHCQQQEGAREWLNLIKLTVPATVKPWSPASTNRSLCAIQLPLRYFLPVCLGS